MSRRAALVAAAVLAVACAGDPTVPEEAARESAAATEIPTPDVSQMEGPVRRRIEAARQAVVAQPRSGDAWGTLGVACDAHGLSGCAATAYDRAVELAPDDFRWVYLAAFLGELRGDPAEQIAERYATASRLEPRLPTIHYRLGDALTRAGRLEEARKAYSEAIAIDPALGVAHRGLGQAALAAGDVETAVEHLREAERLGGGEERATLVSLAQALERAGQSARAREVARRAATATGEMSIPDPVRLRVKESNISSAECARRAAGLIAAGRYDAALAQLRIVEQSKPRELTTVYGIGLCLTRLGRPGEGMRYLETAARLAPENEEVQRELRAARAASGR